MVRLLVPVIGLLVGCGGSEEPEGPPHTCEGYVVEVRTADSEDDALATELNDALFAGRSSELCLAEFNGRVICGSRCGDDWDREEATAEAERIRAYLDGTHPDLVLLRDNPQVLDCACRIY